MPDDATPRLRRYLEECGSSCPFCDRANQIRRWFGSARHVPGDGPRTVQIQCSCSGCGGEWFEQYALVGVTLRGG
jgi:hypothetical protein